MLASNYMTEAAFCKNAVLSVSVRRSNDLFHTAWTNKDRATWSTRSVGPLGILCRHLGTLLCSVFPQFPLGNS